MKKEIIFNLKEVQLLRKSSIINFAENEFWNTIVHLKSPIYSDDILSSNISNKEKQIIINTHRDFFKLAFDEWEALEKCECVLGKCDRCSKKIKNIFFIRNKINSNEMHIGSECIKGFKGIDKNFKIEEYTKHIKKGQAEGQRKNDLIIRYPNIVEYMRKLKLEYDDIELILPETIHVEYQGSLQQQFAFYDKFLKGDISKSRIDEFDLMMIAHVNIIEKASSWIESNRNNLLICNKGLLSWIGNIMSSEIAVNRIRANIGIIPNDIAARIYNIEFLKRNLNTIKSCLHETLIHIGIVNNLIYLKFNVLFIDNITIECTPKIFMQNFGQAAFGGEVSIKFEKYKIYDDIQGVDEYIELFSRFTNNTYVVKINHNREKVIIKKAGVKHDIQGYIANTETFIRYTLKVLYLTLKKESVIKNQTPNEILLKISPGILFKLESIYFNGMKWRPLKQVEYEFNGYNERN